MAQKETDSMKQQLKRRPILEKWFYTQSPLVITRPALRETAACMGFLIAGFLLSCGQLAGAPVPFALGLIAAVGGGLRGLCSLIGCVAGALTMQSFSQGLELTSAALLTFVTMYIFGSLWVTKQSWFQCLVPGIMRGAVGIIFLFSKTLTPLLLAHFVQNVMLAALSPLAFDSLLQKKRRSVGSMLSAGFLVVGLARLPLPGGVNAGIIAACSLAVLSARRTEPGTAAAVAAVTGLGLDAAGVAGGQWSMILCAGALAGSSIPRRHPVFRTLLSMAGLFGALLYFGTVSASVGLSLGIGIIVSLLLPGTLITGREDSAIEQSSALVEQRLSAGETALRQLYSAIGLDPEEKAQEERAHIFDKAAAKVCRQCSRYSSCWEKNSQATYHTFHGALGPILDRGEALREDFPEEFANECRHMEGLLVALNQELDGITGRFQCRSRSEEKRLVASRSLIHMAEILSENARQLRSVQCTPQEAFDACFASLASFRI